MRPSYGGSGGGGITTPRSPERRQPHGRSSSPRKRSQKQQLHQDQLEGAAEATSPIKGLRKQINSNPRHDHAGAGVFSAYIHNLQDDELASDSRDSGSDKGSSQQSWHKGASRESKIATEHSEEKESIPNGAAAVAQAALDNIVWEEASVASALRACHVWPTGESSLDPGSASMLPLSAYYDKLSDPIVPDSINFPVSGVSVLARPEDTEWEDARVESYDPETDRYVVETCTDGDNRYVQVPRVRLYFPSEPVEDFVRRYVSAYFRREQAHLLIRYNLYVDCMPAQVGAALSEAQLQRIVNYALGSSRGTAKDAKARMDVASMLREVQTRFARTLNKIDFDLKMNRSTHEALQKDSLEELPGVLRAVERAGAAPEQGCLPVPSYDAEACYNDLVARSFFADAAALEALDSVHQLCQRLGTEEFRLFRVTPEPQSLSLREFEELQRGQIDTVAVLLTDDWTQAAKTAIKSSMGRDPARWDLESKDRAAYEASELRCFFRNVNLRMTDALHDSVVESIEKYGRFIEEATQYRAEIVSSAEIHVDFLSASANSQTKPLFRVDLVEEVRLPRPKAAVVADGEDGDDGDGEDADDDDEDEEAGGADDDEGTMKAFFGYSEDPQAFVEKARDFVRLGLRAVQGVPQVQRLAMDRLYWGEIPEIATVTEEDPLVEKTESLISTSLENSFGELGAYLDQLDRFLPILRLDVDSFMAELEEPFRAAEERLQRKIEREERRAEQQRLKEEKEQAFKEEVAKLRAEGNETEAAAMEAKKAEEDEEDEDEDDDDDDDDDDDAEAPTLDTDQIAKYISDHIREKDRVELLIPEAANIGLFEINCSKLRRALSEKHASVVSRLLDFVSRCTIGQCNNLLSRFSDMNQELSKFPQNIEELVEIRNYMGTIPNKLAEVHEEIAKLWKGYDLLDKYEYRLGSKVFGQKWRLFGGTKMILDKVEVTTEMLDKEQVRYANIQKEKQEDFLVHLDKLSKEVASFSQFSDLRRIKSIAQSAADIAEKIRKAQADADLFNSRENLFEQEMTDYEQVTEIARAFQPYESLWLTVSEWITNEEVWRTGKFADLVPEDIEKQVTESYKIMNRSIKFFQKAELPLIKETAETIKSKIEVFRPYMPMITALRNPGMRERHFDVLSEELGFEVRADENFTLEQAIGLNLHEHSETISKVAGVAAKEFQIEQALDKMEHEWENVYLDCRPYKDTGTFVLGGIDEIMAILDEHITMTQAMQFSSFKGPFVERIDDFDRKLLMTSEVLEEWIAVQRNWLYLQPIFESPDINKQLPAEGKRFSSVDKNWRTTLLQASQQAKALEFCPNPKLLAMFAESNKLLDMVSKGLSDYLETKRGGFSRFYFLSNDELLEILSETKDPQMVQPHLKKCFEGVRSVFFSEDMHITDMKSSEGEVVPLVVQVDPNGKNVEVWMTELEDRMMDSVKDVMWSSMLSYVETPRTEWLQMVPGQCALNASQFHWTREIEEAMDADGNAGVGRCYEQQVRQINDMVALVRDPELKSNARMTISALTVIDVHARDVTDNLFREGVKDKTEFSWISQMRYYWLNGEALEGDMRVMMVSSLRPYGYEYLGNSFRLVITPLTDKCYLTLMGALQMNLGGAPAGPAGTGKTETTKDLAKALAKQCVVFNCSDGLDYLAMGKFFKGLASCGAWACFDEFNRIDVEVLSVVAQQIMTLQAGVTAGLTRIVFEGVEIKLSDQFAVYITMNPGYAGRTELPDNLKALFRPVAMMVPDYALIGEIMLYSFGYEKARICAKKMVATFRLNSEQLSSQPHYDYGMRAVKTTIVAAGNLRRDYPNEDEEILLLRALQDVNLPKFLSHDLPLFRGIISDLFPGKSRPDIDYGALLQCLRVANQNAGLQNTPWFLTKQIQLYETIVVRHGLMLVGPTGGGKSRNVENLDTALGLLKKRGIKGFAYEKIHRYTVNPKSITMGQLYGEFDPNTHEWQDGILANIVRICAKSTTPDRKWVMFDGPVDAIWIENMNTVLDDNKKLCLNSGEIMGLSPEMTMMFEVEDLEVASPATVSRVGVIYMEPNTLGSDPIIQSWIEYRLPSIVKNEHKALLQKLFDNFLQSALTLLRRNLAEPVPTVDNNLLASHLRMMDALFNLHMNSSGGKAREDGDGEGDSSSGGLDLDKDLEPLFIFSLVWSLACTVDSSGRRTFDGWLRNQMEQNSTPCPFPREGLVYDYVWDVKAHSWTKWMETIPPYKYDKDLPFAETIIPTSDSVCYTFLLDILTCTNLHVLMCGDTGTGKSVNINRYLSNGMPADYIPLCLAFSAQTSANQTQDLLDSKMEKRRKGVFGPPAGKRFVIFVDDLNMPKRETYFAQPPIEILRQWFTYGGWYDRKALTFRQIIDVNMVAAMGPPGGGRNPVTPRMLRHYNIITYTPLEQESMATIFGTILGNFLRDSFDGAVAPLADPIVDSTIQIYDRIRSELLPTPSKSHYTFNMRDLSKVFQGMLMVSAKVTNGVDAVVRLWVHECQRVFRDRLVNDEDRDWFNNLVVSKVDKDLKLDWNKIKPETEYMIFGDLLEPDNKIYQEIVEIDTLLPAIEQYLVEYNAESKTPMHLQLFMDAIQHVSRIARVIRQPMGNALLLGVGGSGRKSLTRLAAYIGDFAVFQVEIAKGYGLAEWREDIKACLLKAGVDDVQVVFLFDDSQIIMSQMLEDINGILNQGDVPNLYAPEDMEKIMTACRGDCAKRKIAPTKINIFSSFILRVKRNVHVVMCMSPGTPIFRDRLRMFPALVNCCTIDWFSEWPDEALRSVGLGIMQAEDLQMGDHLDNVVELFKVFHQSVANKSRDFFEELRRYNYVTPTSYLELLTTFKNLLQVKRDEVQQKKQRLQIGLDKLTTTAAQVADLQVQLTDMQPVLAKTQVEVDEMIVQIKKDKAAADETKAIVSKEEEAAQEKAQATKAIADDAQRDLDEALPALDEAVKCLSKLKKGDIVEVGSLKTPPSGVKLTMEAACIMFEVKPKMVADPANMGKKVKDYWEPAQKTLLNDANKFLERLFNFDKDNIPDKVIREIEAYMQNPDFTPKEIEKASKACTAICMWVRAMHKYHFIALGVEPKRKKLAEAEAELKVTMEKLDKARSELQAVMDNIQALEDGYNQSVAKKEQLARDVEQCSARLDRAQKLIGGLGGEKDRWTSAVAQFETDYVNLLGDVLISSGAIAYLGPFTSVYRSALTDVWIEELMRLKIPHTPGVDIIKTLGEPVVIRGWNIAGLPDDAHSVQNAIVMEKARRWPLLIDPQTQANRFIKNLGKESVNGIEVVKQSDKNLIRCLENGVRFGKWVLMENVGTKLDAALEPVLLQQTFIQDGQVMMKLGDNTVPYHEEFRFFMTTKLPNPHYPPEVAVKVSLLNFSITPRGLEEQLLGIVMVNELPELEQRKNEIVVQNAEMGKKLKEIEDTILYMLSNSQGNILDDAELIETLATSKVTSQEINTKVAESKETEKEIDAEREKYRPFAKRGSILYFAIADLCIIDPMYEYSLQWYSQLFAQGILNSEPKSDIEERLEILKDFFTYMLYENVCRSLFERHKLMFSFNLVIKILQGDGLVDSAEYRNLLTGQGSGRVSDLAKPQGAEWVTDKMWGDIQSVSTLPALHGFEDSFVEHVADWNLFFDSETCFEDPLPGGWDDRVNELQRMLILRAIRPDKISNSVQNYIVNRFGQRFIEPPPFEIKKCFDTSVVTTPLIFVLTSGSDPTKSYFEFAETMGMADKLKSISLGQGQGPIAARMIEEGISKGMWILLQNCHLASSWMDELERIVEEIKPETTNPEFRLWLTSMPSKTFPVSVLQDGIKMTMEPPNGMRANLRGVYFKFDDDQLKATTKPGVYMRLLFGLCFFHALIQERRKFGPLGWNVPYEFNETDLEISQRQLEMYLDEYEEIPFECLKFLTARINYGGRVTDAIDIRTMDVLLEQFYQPDALNDGFKFCPREEYFSPAVDEDNPIRGYRTYIEGLPVNAPPEVFGMNTNANITSALQETNEMLDTLVLLQPRTSSGGGASREDIIEQDIIDFQQRFPRHFSIEAIRMDYPVRYEESMNTVLQQECARFERLLSVIESTLIDLRKALRGLMVMSGELEAMSNAMYAQKTPELWESASYPSLMPLRSYFADFVKRCNFLQDWIRDGMPTTYWLSAYFFPQAFLTGQLQNYARKHQLPIDTISFEFDVVPESETHESPEDGCYVHGLYLEGARWSFDEFSVVDSLPKQLFADMAPIHFVPIHGKSDKEEGYKTPLYKTLRRAGTLSTTGHSTNFVMYLQLPSNVESAKWIKAGVALFCALKY